LWKSICSTLRSSSLKSIFKVEIIRPKYSSQLPTFLASASQLCYQSLMITFIKSQRNEDNRILSIYVMESICITLRSSSLKSIFKVEIIRPKYSSPLPINLLYTHHLWNDSCMVHYVHKKFSQ